METLALVMGSKGGTVSLYKLFSTAINAYIKKTGESLYPCYATLLNTSLRILRSSVFVHHCNVEASVNIERAGVQHKYIEERRRGGNPNVSIAVIIPSAWGRQDLFIYDYMHKQTAASFRIPVNIDVEHAPFISAAMRRTIPTTLYERYQGDLGHETGQELYESCAVVLKVSDPQAVEAFTGDTFVQCFGDRGIRGIAIRCHIGKTRFAEATNSEDDIRICDAITELLDANGHHWRGAVLIHRFSPTRPTISLSKSFDEFRRACLVQVVIFENGT